MSKKQTAVDWLYDKIKSHFEHDGDLLESFKIITSIAKQMERKQIEEAHLAGQNSADLMDGETEIEYYTQTYE